MFSFCFSIVGSSFSVSFSEEKLYRYFLNHFSEFLIENCNNDCLKIQVELVDSPDRKLSENTKDYFLVQVIKESKNFRQLVLDASWKIKVIVAAVLSKKGFLLLHASAVKIKKKVVIFLGDSGAGKSTVSRIAEEAGYKKVCDDSVLIDTNQNELMVYSTPFIEKEKEFYKRKSWKLGSLYFLHQSSKDYKKRLDRVQAVKNIIKHSYIADIYKKDSKKAIQVVTDLSMKVSEKAETYDLLFTKSDNFLKVINDK